LEFPATPSNSPDGGTWIGLGRSQNSWVERFGQRVDNFTVGASYELSWFASNFGYDSGFGYTNANQIEAFLGFDSIGKGGVVDFGPGWVAQSLIFTATAASHTIAFQLGSPNESYMGIDGVTLSLASTTVPEPATVSMFLGGLAGLAGLRMRKRKAS
jgi:hypothetical protein